MIFTFFQISPALAAAWLLAIFMALTVHEFSHALVAKWRGDRTAEDAGRLTLNPISHIDGWGLAALLLLGFGWAKPVPFNPYNLKNPKWDSVAIALAGPASNLILAVAATVALRILLSTGAVAAGNLLLVFLFFTIIINLFLLFFNVIPVHPLDGSKLFIALLDHPKYASFLHTIMIRGPQVLMAFVLVSLLTHWNVFFFVSAPAYAACGGLMGRECAGLLDAILLP